MKRVAKPIFTLAIISACLLPIQSIAQSPRSAGEAVEYIYQLDQAVKERKITYQDFQRERDALIRQFGLRVNAMTGLPYRDVVADGAKQRVEFAKANMTAALRDQCFESAKSNMNDPSSFQWAGDFQADAMRSDYDKVNTGRDTSVIYVATIRGKNQYGALVKVTLHCVYEVNQGKINFFQARFAG